MLQSSLSKVLVVDVHETKIIEALKLLDVPFIIKKLDAGDFVCGKLIIERKSFDDFMRSLFNKRIFLQAEKMKEFGNPVFLIEGQIDWSRYNTFLAAQASLMMKYNASFLYSLSAKTTAYLLKKILEKQDEKAHYTIIKKRNYDKIISVIASLPDIGEKRALLLYKQFSSLKDLFNASLDKLTNLLGRKRGIKLYELFNKKFKDK